MAIHDAAPVLAGLLTWRFLNRHTVRGDYFLLYSAFLLASLSAYNYWLADPRASFMPPSLSSSTSPHSQRAHTLFLATLSWTGHRHLELERLHERYGKFVRIGPNILSTNDSSELITIYGAKTHLDKPDSYNLPGSTGEVALFFKQSRDDHAARKHIWAQAFTMNSISNFFTPLHRNTWYLMKCIADRTRPDGSVNLYECLCHWAYDIMGDATFGGTNGLRLMKDGDPKNIVEGGKIATVVLDSFGLCPWLIDILWWLPGLATMDSMKELKALAASMIQTRVRNSDNVKIRDLMSYLLEGDARTGRKIDMADLQVDAITTASPGSDNTSTTLIVAVYFMLCRPSLWTDLRVKLEEVIEDPTADLDKTTLASIPLLDAILKEALRFASPYYVPREVPPGGVTVAGRYFPPSVILASANHAVHMSEENFSPEPRTFLPERWLPGGLGPNTVTNQSALSSFTFGPHHCLGKNFAMHEMRMCLARMVLMYDFELTGGHDRGEFYRGLRNARTTLFDKPLVVNAKLRRASSSPLTFRVPPLPFICRIFAIFIAPGYCIP
ncbi:cytochrome P450 [Epithele typhae]|uniref:cytochrome P450 n=1 Tax=Epithele typhae TaxID=378194 RepID=UPI002007D394|nr:cytochrome P450 [Epithele typhae]KAH9944241.1 cytochrome P450 [Epithele typhae]